MNAGVADAIKSGRVVEFRKLGGDWKGAGP
jgi:hypothetical protein